MRNPWLGLAPIVVSQIYAFIGGFARNSGAAVVVSGQMAAVALRVADHGLALRRRRVAMAGCSTELSAGGLAAAYL